MRKHPINKHVRSPRPTQHELENPKTRHRALVRMGRHRNMVKGAADRRDTRAALCFVNGDQHPAR